MKTNSATDSFSTERPQFIRRKFRGSRNLYIIPPKAIDRSKQQLRLKWIAVDGSLSCHWVNDKLDEDK